MKKQFLRVKQLADQTFLGAEKSELLTIDLQRADIKVEFFRIALNAISKNLSKNQGQSIDSLEKRLKKCPDYQLGVAMQEYGKDDLEDLLRPVLMKCGKTQVELAREMIEHEIKIEQMVLSPVQSMVEVEIPNIHKQKRTLSKLNLDKDAAHNRYQTALKHGTATKNESLKDEWEEAELKFEQCRDTLACEMYAFLRKESEFAQHMLQLVKIQRAYHESALRTLEALIPELEKEIGNSPIKAVFGCPLDEHLRLNHRKIALPLELCVCALWELGMAEEGLFRVAGGALKVRRLKLFIDSGCDPNLLQFESRDVHVIASTLKSYLRELPEPLLTYDLYNDWIYATKQPTEELRLQAISNILKRLPKPNYDNLKYLIKFLFELSKNTQNRMSTFNIAIVIAPNLLWSYNDVCNGLDMGSATIVNAVVEMLLNHVDRFFPGEFNAYVLFKKDLFDFEQSSNTHSRTGSYDTSSILLDQELHTSIMNDRNSPPQGSPKPVTRRKNKPAPVPPLAMNNRSDPEKTKSAFISGSVTINRQAYRATKAANEEAKKMSASVGTEDGMNFNSVRRKSLDFDHQPTKAVNNKKVEAVHINKTDISSPMNFDSTVDVEALRSTDINYTSLPMTNAHVIHQITAQTGTVGRIKVTSDNLQQKSRLPPVAAPRTVVPEVQRSNSKPNVLKNETEEEDEVVLRRSSKEEEKPSLPAKPVVPERPVTLRPSSFRGLRSDSEFMMLERTHMYSVPDKQQVSIVQVAQNRSSGEKHKPGHDTQMAEKEKFLGHLETAERVPLPRHSLENRIDDINSNDVPPNLVRTLSVGSKPERPPKLDHVKSLESFDIEPPNNNTSHNSVEDLDELPSPKSPTQAPLSPRSGISRIPPQRPQPPPPPPPVKAKADGESTDL